MDAVMTQLNELGHRLSNIEAYIAVINNNNNKSKAKKSGHSMPKRRCQGRKSAATQSAATKEKAGRSSTWTRSQNPDFPALYKLMLSFVRVCCCVSTGDYKVPCRVGAGLGRALDFVHLPGDPKK